MKINSEILLQKGISAHKSGQLQQAEIYYRKILKYQPNHSNANHNLGILNVAVDKPKAALLFFKTALKSNPQIQQFWKSYITTLINLQNYKTAKSVLQKAKKSKIDQNWIEPIETHLSDLMKSKAPSNKQINNLLYYYKNLKFEDTIEIAKSLILEFPEHPFAWKILGAINLQSGKNLDALKINEKVTLLSPNDPEAHNNLGISFYELGRFDEALESYKKAVKLKPNFAIAYNNLGNTEKSLGNFKKAEKNYKTAIHFSSKYSEAYNNLGVISQILGKLNFSKANYKKAIELNPNFAEAYNNLGYIYEKLKKPILAEKNYKHAISLKPTYYEAHSNLGNISKELGKLDQAKSNYKNAININPDFTSAKHQLSALQGITTPIAPRDYVENLFDNYADNFERSLIDKLEYNLPNIITEVIIKNQPAKSLGSVLDLGCGTGLIGQEIKKYCDYLEGIDLSKAMLRIAKNKKIYDSLSHGDIIEYLSTQDLKFDFFIAADVFIYIGDLSLIFQSIKTRNKSGGKLVFSIEESKSEDFSLQKTCRYSHSTKYVKLLCDKFDYEIIQVDRIVLRKEKKEYINGFVFLLKF